MARPARVFGASGGSAPALIDGALLARSFSRYVAPQCALGGVEQARQGAELDPVGFGACLAHVIGLFNHASPGSDAVRQFAAVGYLAKVTDDVIDLWDDMVDGRVNLVFSLLRVHPAERARSRARSGRMASC
ncbi:hypothetical protein ACH4E7_35170 [Kitasatospora sp. NPDC018058]|uniref:hypothetical protein n=1 Tax=Kitasatospora sp. NPDC018058 TaxID=3364025 RepID=UPI0037C0E34C